MKKKAKDDSGWLARWLDIAKGLLEQPTAPYLEQQPQAYVRHFARLRPDLTLHEDPSGNILLKYSSRGASRKPPLVMVAHLDHPGFWIDSVAGGKAALTFKGGVGAGHARPGTAVRFFEIGQSQPSGRGELIEAAEKNARLAGASARVLSGTAVAGGFAMWDFPGFALEDQLIVARCCDDLLGAAAALCTLDEIVRNTPPDVHVWALFTRAEEVGFLGALEAIRRKTIPKNASVLSLECSKAAGIAPQGEGVVVRVGDKASIFDPSLTEALRYAAESVRRQNPEFKYQRKLMDGGACEATAFCAYGYRASGLAVPLGNYHNQAFDAAGPAIGPETVRVDDFVCEVLLLIELARRPELLDERSLKRPAWLAERTEFAKRELGRDRRSSRKAGGTPAVH